MPRNNDLKVHLDHLLPRESFRWVNANPNEWSRTNLFPSPIRTIKYYDLHDRSAQVSWFSLLRKPDFQRETSAWSPEDCLALLESIVSGLIIPSLIVWKNPENNYLYVLDGAHRLSVLRAWIVDDWGDKAPEGYYERYEYAEEIKQAAVNTRNIINATIGAFTEFVNAGTKYLDLTREGKSPKDELTEKDFAKGVFYTDIMTTERGFQVQEVPGDYERAEASFLVINRSGQPLADWETTLIENRHSSLARAIMSIANGGSGRFWPEGNLDDKSKVQLPEIKEVCQKLHQKIFVPPMKVPISDANVPFVAATRYFPKHTYLLELLPLIDQTNDVGRMFAIDRSAENDAIVNNGYRLVKRTERVFQHLTGTSADPLSLSLVPLFYFYTKAGRYVRSSLYGFIVWLTSGTDDEVRTRKLIFSANRGRFEQVIFDQDIPGAITRRIGSGPRATAGTADFFNKLLALLVKEKSEVSTENFQKELKVILDKMTAPRLGGMQKEGRRFDDTQKTAINLRELFKSAIRCEICGGILDLRLGTQYDHTIPFATSRVTDPEYGRPTHPFCNHSREQIEGYRDGNLDLKLPMIRRTVFESPGELIQLSLFDLFDQTIFPDEPLN